MSTPTRLALASALLLWLPALAADSIPTEVQLPVGDGPGLFELARQVSAGDDTEQRDFAWIALSELLAAYEGEAETSRLAKTSDAKERRKLGRWRSATWAFSDQLRGRLDALDNGGEVRVYAQRPNPVMIAVDGQPTVISGPKASDDRQLEQRIVVNYCWLHPCETASEPEPGHENPPLAPDPGGSWQYSQGRSPEYVTGDGLVFQFKKLDNARTTGNRADRLAAELRELADQLRGVLQVGTRVGWEHIGLLPRTGDDQHWVLLNQTGDYLRSSLPHLYRNPELLQEAIPWLRAQAEGQPMTLAIDDAGRFTQEP